MQTLRFTAPAMREASAYETSTTQTKTCQASGNAMSRRRDHPFPTHKANARRRARLTRLYRRNAARDAQTMRGKR